MAAMFAAPVCFQTDAVPAYACVEATMKAAANIEIKTVLIKSPPYNPTVTTYMEKTYLHGHRSHFLKNPLMKYATDAQQLHINYKQCCTTLQLTCNQVAKGMQQYARTRKIWLIIAPIASCAKEPNPLVCIVLHTGCTPAAIGCNQLKQIQVDTKLSGAVCNL
jgi:hypothetical protein